MRIFKPSELDSLKRGVDGGTEEQRNVVQSIIKDVQLEKDQALYRYTKKFDGADLDSIRVQQSEIDEALHQMDEEDLQILREAASNIRSFHEKQLRQSWFETKQDGTMLGQKVTPLDAVGVYVPGGTAAYPSSVFMNLMPAVVAGVERVVMVTPPSESGDVPAGVLAAAHIAGVEEIYKVGGAQAVAGLAYGTESIPRVDKIVGPGNIFVALAKREVFGDVDIDMIAGPSEIVVLADETARANEVAADLLSQAEHDERSASIFVTTSPELAENVANEVNAQLAELPRYAIARVSIENEGGIVLCQSMDEAIEAVNSLAPEHLEVMTEEPMSLLGSIKHAGAIFLGRYSSEPVGDYFAGPNHVLPTSGTARFSSPLNVDDFMKKSSVIYYSREAYNRDADKIARFARLEGLEAHARAIESRKDRDES